MIVVKVFVGVYALLSIAYALDSDPTMASTSGSSSSRGQFKVPLWPPFPQKWGHFNLDALLEDENATAPGNVSLEQLVKNSDDFPIEFPINTVRCKTLSNHVGKESLEKYINSAYPVVHENALALYAGVLYNKRKFGTESERNLYQNMSLLQFVERLLTKRAVAFVGPSDRYLLLDGTKGFGKWETIGKGNEPEKLSLEKCLSYDEIKLSAFLSISSYTHFINDGNRHNMGEVKRGDVEEDGIIIGLIGARLEKPRVMEYEELIISKEQNDGFGYGSPFLPTIHTMFSGFYNEIAFTYQDALFKNEADPKRFYDLGDGVFFDNEVYCKRLSVSFDTLLLEANQRAKERNTLAFVHVVGIGLGVWKLAPHQSSLFLETFVSRIQEHNNELTSISDVVFYHFGENVTILNYKDGDRVAIDNHPENGIKIHISNREPHTKLKGKDEGKLLVVSYAWDANALPGNEFWVEDLSSSGDPASACSTQISELHNPHINPKVSAENLRVAGQYGVVPYQEYCRLAKESSPVLRL